MSAAPSTTKLGPFRTTTSSQSEIFPEKLLLWLVLLSGPAHPPKVKYSLKTVIVACSVYLHFRSTPSQSEIFSQAVIVACSLCSYVCIGLPGPAHPPKVKYSLSKLLLWLVLCICIPGPAHPPKVKYSVKAVIVACSYGVSFQALHTLPKRDTVNLTVCEILIFASMRSCPSLEKTH